MVKKKKEIREVMTTRIKPSVKKKATDKASKEGTNISRIVEAKLVEYNNS